MLASHREIRIRARRSKLPELGHPTKNIHIETASGARHERPVLTKLLAQLQKGDVLMTFRLDRLGRSLPHLVKTLEDLEARGIGFETLDGVSTRDGATGKLVMHILSSVAQFERQLLIERTMAGLKAARAEGRTGANRRKMSPQDITNARKRMNEGLKTREVAAMYGVSERSLWRNLRWVQDLEEVRAGA